MSCFMSLCLYCKCIIVSHFVDSAYIKFIENDKNHFIHFNKFTDKRDPASIASDSPPNSETSRKGSVHNYDFAVAIIRIQLMNMIFLFSYINWTHHQSRLTFKKLAFSKQTISKLASMGPDVVVIYILYRFVVIYKCVFLKKRSGLLFV